jgi:hypothetical protein
MNNIFELSKYYFNLSRVERILFKEKTMKVLNISYMTFHAWLTRNNIPKIHRDKFANEVLEKQINS